MAIKADVSDGSKDPVFVLSVDIAMPPSKDPPSPLAAPPPLTVTVFQCISAPFALLLTSRGPGKKWAMMLLFMGVYQQALIPSPWRRLA